MSNQQDQNELTELQQGIFGDGQTVSVPSIDSNHDHDEQTTQWPAAADDPSELTELQRDIIQAAAHPGYRYQTFDQIKEQCSNDPDRSWIRKTLKRHWNEQYHLVNQSTPEPEIFVCPTCAVYNETKPNGWEYCPKCGTEIPQCNYTEEW